MGASTANSVVTDPSVAKVESSNPAVGSATTASTLTEATMAPPIGLNVAVATPAPIMSLKATSNTATPSGPVSVTPLAGLTCPTLVFSVIA